MRRILAILLLAVSFTASAQGDLYRNPVIYADYSDPDVIRVGNDYWMTASSFQCVPGLQILHSRNLVDWEIVGAALPEGPYSYWNAAEGTPVEFVGPMPIRDGEGMKVELAGGREFGALPLPSLRVQHGCGVWAPSIRYHDGLYWIFWGDPDYGIYQVHASDPRGPWSEPVRIIAGKGFIDPCPLWDEDGRVWLVHAWAASRCGVKSVLHVCELDQLCTSCISSQERVFDGRDNGQVTVEGPKFYKKDGWYWIFAPAGGVKTGWQLAMRSRNVAGPYEYKVVMQQGSTKVCGPHQGGWVSDVAGSDWFLHFEDRYAWGRVVHLQPMRWTSEGWPVIGVDIDADGIGEPVAEYRRPACQDPAWQKVETGRRRMQHRRPVSAADHSMLYQLQGLGPAEGDNLWNRPDLNLAKLEGPHMRVVDVFEAGAARRAGIVVMGAGYSTIELRDGQIMRTFYQQDAPGRGTEKVIASVPMQGERVWFRVLVREGELPGASSSDIPAICTFQYSFDGRRYTDFGQAFKASAGRWIGAKAGVFRY